MVSKLILLISILLLLGENNSIPAVTPTVKLSGVGGSGTFTSNTETLILATSNTVKTGENAVLKVTDVMTKDPSGNDLTDTSNTFTTVSCFRGSNRCVLGTNHQTSVYVEISNDPDPSKAFTNIKLFSFDNSTIGGDNSIPSDSGAVNKIITLGNSNYFIAAHRNRGLLRWDISNNSSFVQYIPSGGFSVIYDLTHLKDSKFGIYSISNQNNKIFFFDVTTMTGYLDLSVSTGAGSPNNRAGFLRQMDNPKNSYVLSAADTFLNVVDFSGLGSQVALTTIAENISGVTVFDYSNFIVTCHNTEGKLAFYAFEAQNEDPIEFHHKMDFSVADPKNIEFSSNIGSLLLHSSNLLSILEITFEVELKNPLCSDNPAPLQSFSNYKCGACESGAKLEGDFCVPTTYTPQGGKQTFEFMSGSPIKATGWIPKPSELSDSTRDGNIVRFGLFIFGMIVWNWVI